MSIIRSIEAFPIRLQPHGASPRYILRPDVRSAYPSAEEILLVRIASDDHVGWGEALAPVTPEAPAAVVTELIAPLLQGRRVAPPRPTTFLLQETMRERGHLSGHHADAVAAVDVALWDLWGKTAGRPVHELLGGAYREQIPLYHTQIGGATPEERADAAAAVHGEGFSRIKLHLTDQPDVVVRQLDAVLEATASSHANDHPALVAVDAHWVHDLGSARRLGRALDERGAWFFEAPLAPEDVLGHRRLADAIDTPIAVGEALRHRFEFTEWAAAGALAVGQPDVGRTGISEASAIAGILSARHLTLAPHHSMATAIAFAAAVHVSAAAERLLALEYAPSIGRRGVDFVHAPLLQTVQRGAVDVPQLPGLGVEVDEDAVRALVARSF